MQHHLRYMAVIESPEDGEEKDRGKVEMREQWRSGYEEASKIGDDRCLFLGR